jgi:hypothetical protein
MSEDLNDASSAYLRSLAAKIAGILVHKDGVEAALAVYGRIIRSIEEVYTAERSADA